MATKVKAGDNKKTMTTTRAWRGKLVRATYQDNHQGNGEVDK